MIEATLRAALSQPASSSSDQELAGGPAPSGEGVAAAVLIAFDANTGDLWLTKRASALRNHGGQIALPGGRVDPGDRDTTDAALREAHEEIGLPRDAVHVLATLPEHRTITGFSMIPVLATVTSQFLPKIEPGEVEEVFTLPFDHVTNPQRYHLRSRHWRGQERRYLVAPYGPYYLWGATARILHGLALRISAAREVSGRADAD